MSVPWSVEYNKTKFCFILEKKANVVLVLSQLDDRYFAGLAGQYEFELSFRVHRAGEEDYIVRSHGGYSMRRSVTAELELEAGEYHVLVKIEATRNTNASPVEDVVRNNVKERRDKLLRIGLAYDLAHAKGEIKETEEEKKGRKKAAAINKAKEKKTMREKLEQEKKKSLKMEQWAPCSSELGPVSCQDRGQKMKQGHYILTLPLDRTHNDNKEKRKLRAADLKRKEKAKAKAEKLAAANKEKTQKDTSKPEAKAKAVKETKSNQKTEARPAEPEATTVEREEPVANGPANEQASGKSETAIAAHVTGEATEKNENEPPSIDFTEKSEDTNAAASKTLEIPIISARASVAPSISGFDSDGESDIVSVISDISSGVVSDAIAEASKLVAEAANVAPPPPNSDDEDEFERDPWNAIAVVGLRVYSKDSGVSVKVIRPRDWEHVEGKGEAKLDVDDSAADATKDIELKGGAQEESKK
ncbi:hypothetical protein LHYA1_G008123 [Lachnellula hyalina]|uniref:Uncharacterized protein n=1 Tax=Lachnellula hyalina TaxID=1316788 RepID=A0A8H8QVL3_9HELO|nr:uncharacterized protein LHYA1_G008123 [Lachnellula hyalina]TVY22911.1 hypothetical protein LHYA1_G008123 [Lachnellula hyalina]